MKRYKISLKLYLEEKKIVNTEKAIIKLHIFYKDDIFFLNRDISSNRLWFKHFKQLLSK